MDKASAYGAGGCRFESYRDHLALVQEDLASPHTVTRVWHDVQPLGGLGRSCSRKGDITMMAPAHAQGHAGPAWSPPGGLEPPTVPGLEVRRRIHDAKGAMLERL